MNAQSRMKENAMNEDRKPLAERFTQLSNLGKQSDEQRIETFQGVLDALQRELNEISE